MYMCMWILVTQTLAALVDYYKFWQVKFSYMSCSPLVSSTFLFSSLRKKNEQCDVLSHSRIWNGFNQPDSLWTQGKTLIKKYIRVYVCMLCVTHIHTHCKVMLWTTIEFENYDRKSINTIYDRKTKNTLC